MSKASVAATGARLASALPIPTVTALTESRPRTARPGRAASWEGRLSVVSRPERSTQSEQTQSQPAEHAGKLLVIPV